MRRIMCLSINRLSVDQGHKKQRAGQDWEIQDHVEFAKKIKKDTNLQFYHFCINPGFKVLLLFYTQPGWMHLRCISEMSHPASQRRL